MGSGKAGGRREGGGAREKRERGSFASCVLVLIAPLAHFPPKTYASIFSFPLSQSSRLILATPRVPGRFMSQRKTERHLHHLSGKVMM